MVDTRREGEYCSPLAIHCVWNCADSKFVGPIIDLLEKNLSRDEASPFSHGINTPIFVYPSQNARETPPPLRAVSAYGNICIFFTSEETAGRKNWTEYGNDIVANGQYKIVPVALNSNGFSLFEGINAIRYEDADEPYRIDRCVVAILHEIFRYGFSLIDPTKCGKESSLKLFLSHSKGDGGRGVNVVHGLRRVISTTNMGSFFDASEISPGMRFDEEIEKHLNCSNCAFVAIQTDSYAARYWCQREIFAAKRKELPILVVNYLAEFEDRGLPALYNVPVMRIDEVSEGVIIGVLGRTLVEVIRCLYVKALMAEYKRLKWIPAECETLMRPPESMTVQRSNVMMQRMVCYPDPPLFTCELEWLEAMGVYAFTPLQYIMDSATSEFLVGKSIGISISDVSSTLFDQQCCKGMLKSFAQEVGRHILYRAGRLIYGGDLRLDGFTEFILSEAAALQKRINTTDVCVVNYLAWPIHLLAGKDMLTLRSRYHGILDVQELPPSDDIRPDINPNEAVSPNTPNNSYIWSRCLTHMRKVSIENSFARVCAGGRLYGYKGKMPGVLEEIAIAISRPDLPLYLCGGYGGVVGAVCSAMLNGEVPECLTEKWQIEHNAGYRDLQAEAKLYGNAADYMWLEQILCRRETLEEISNRSGLSIDEYQHLMQSPFADECIHLILKGLSRVANHIDYIP